MAGQLEDAAREFISALDAMDVDRLIGSLSGDVQGIDEISRRWLRGREEVGAYLRQLADTVGAVRTDIRDIAERASDHTGILTCWLHQEYTLAGSPQHVSAPTTMAFRLEGAAWKLTLFHSIPLPAED